MKTIILILFLSAHTMTGCAQKTLVGTKQGESYKIEANQEALKTEWNQLLKNQGIQSQIVGFEITTQVDTAANNQIRYILIGKTKDASVKVATLLTLQGTELYRNDGTTVTCSGCRIGCNPLYVANQWMCTSCQETGTCTKTVTVTTN